MKETLKTLVVRRLADFIIIKPSKRVQALSGRGYSFPGKVFFQAIEK
jgi:hypothetical protein